MDGSLDIDYWNKAFDAVMESAREFSMGTADEREIR